MFQFATLLLGSQRAVVLVIVLGTLALESYRERSADAPWGLKAVPLSRLSLSRVQLRPMAYVLLVALTIIMQPSVGPRFIYFQF